MRHQEPQPAPRMVQARDVKARTPIHPRPREGESRHYSLPMTEPDVKFALCPPILFRKNLTDPFLDINQRSGLDLAPEVNYNASSSFKMMQLPCELLIILQ
jgi:hypothetical protein